VSAGLEVGNTSAMLPVEGGLDAAVTGFLRAALEKGAVNAVLLPMEVPSGNSFAWILMKDPALVGDARAMAPVMPVQGARALRSLTRKGEGSLRVLALMRPCEVRAARELAKLGQVRTGNLILATWDCPGAVPMKDFIDDPALGEERFAGMLTRGEPLDGVVKPSCLSCADFSMTDADLHFCNFGSAGGYIPVLARSPEGQRLLQVDGLPLEAGSDIEDWERRIAAKRETRLTARQAAFEETGRQARGFQGMLTVFADCIGCRNCRAACPVCYCRLCYFDSETAKPEPGAFLDAATVRGGVSLPANRLLFHIGRMTHMSLSCVSCGQCSDACPVDIPVAEVFSLVGHRTRETFEYSAGRNDGVPLPLRTFLESELAGIREQVRDAEPGGQSHE
jgi:formate dehydrogenase (coenzyme F420) beta subunit